ncbi:MAG: hypothetical protein K6T99_01280 [Armatimonadetes bacterium]|nr:hypothetical protein [Armatimonadota bacterium]
MKNEITPEVLQQKLARALKAKAVLTERTKQLQQQIDDFRRREEVMNHIAYELLERQREVNYMLHRASSVLHQLQDTNLAIEGELKQLKGELPEPEDPKWEETVAKVNELFEKSRKLATEVQNEITRGIFKEEPLESVKFTETLTSNKTSINAQEQREIKDAQAQNEAETVSSEDTSKALEVTGEQSEATKLERSPEKSANEEDLIEQFFRSIQCDETGRIAGKMETAKPKRGLMSRLRQFFHIGT